MNIYPLEIIGVITLLTSLFLPKQQLHFCQALGSVFLLIHLFFLHSYFYAGFNAVLIILNIILGFKEGKHGKKKSFVGEHAAHLNSTQAG